MCRPRKEPTNFARWNRSGTPHSQPIPAGCRRRNTPGDTTVHPSLGLRSCPAAAPLRSYISQRRRVPSPPSKIDKLIEHIVKEKRQPDAFAFAFLADQVHAVIPVATAHERQTMGAERQTVVHRPDAMLVECGNFIGNLRQVVVRLLVGPQQPGTQKRHAFIQHSRVAGGAHIAAKCVGKPKIIIRKMRAHAAADRRVPPVLHVAFVELATGSAQQMLAQEARLGMNESHPVLQLVAETERAPGLVEPGASPHPTGERLIDKPAVSKEIDGPVGRFDVHHAQGPAPVVPNAFEGAVGVAGAAEALHKLSCLIFTAGGADDENDVFFLAVVERDLHLHGRAWIESRSDAARKAHASERGRICRRAVAAQKLRAVAGHGSQRLARVDENDPVGKLGAKRIASEQSAAGRVDLRDDMHQRFVPHFAEHQLPVTGRRKPAQSAGAVGDLETDEFYRRIGCDIKAQLRNDAVLGILENAVTETVPGDIIIFAAGRLRRWRPKPARFLVAEINRLAADVSYRIVVPRRDPEFVTVLRPGVNGAALGDYRAKLSHWR